MPVNETSRQPKKGTAPQLHRAAWQGVLWEESLEEVFFMKFCLGTWRVDVYHCKHIVFKTVRESFVKVLGIILALRKRKRT